MPTEKKKRGPKAGRKKCCEKYISKNGCLGKRKDASHVSPYKTIRDM